MSDKDTFAGKANICQNTLDGIPVSPLEGKHQSLVTLQMEFVS